MRVKKKKTIHDLQKKFDITDSPIKLNILYKYDFLKDSWVFSGYRCHFCDRPLSREKMKEHSEICKILHKII